MPAKSGISKSRPAQTSPAQTSPAQTSPAQTSPAQTSPAQSRSGRTIARTVDSAVALGTNIVIVRAVINRVPESRVLASGDDVLAFDMTIRPEGGPAESVPVIWMNPPAAAHNLAEGDDVVVLGAIRRRFFRSGGTTASRTELNARRIVPAGARAKVRSVLESVLGSLAEDAP